MNRARVAAVGLASTLALAIPVTTYAQDPYAELSAAQAKARAVQADLTTANAQLDQAKKDFAPVDQRADQADQTAAAAQARVQKIEDRLVAERTDAAEQVQSANDAYQDDQASHDTTTAVGLGVALAAVVVALSALAWNRFTWIWLLPRWLMGGILGMSALALIGGVALALVPDEPVAPVISPELQQQASYAEDNPADPPTDELKRAVAQAAPLLAAAERLDRARSQAQSQVTDAQGKVASVQDQLDAAQEGVRVTQRKVNQAEEAAAEEAQFRAEATTIDYDQLIKDPTDYIGDKVVYTGQIFQIQEVGSQSVILLSVTKTYGFWDDEIWVDAGEIASAEDDIITVYGTVTGGKNYRTQIGGSRFVPRIKARYIDE
jgi:hypothetical protein